MANTATLISLSAARQRKLIARAHELSQTIKSAKRELDEILDVFKSEGDGQYFNKDGSESILVYTSERVTLDTATVKGFLTPAEIQAATKSSFVTSAKVL